MIVVGGRGVLEYLRRCFKVVGGLYVCGVDYMLVKGITLTYLADHAFAFVGNIPVLDVDCGRWIMYYGTVEPRFVVEGWRRAESQGMSIVYNCVDDAFEYFEVEEYVFRKVPITMYGFGSIKMYRRLIDLLSRESLYILRRLY